MSKYERPKLPYALHALEPHFDARTTMETHDGKHHATDVNTLQTANSGPYASHSRRSGGASGVERGVVRTGAEGTGGPHLAATGIASIGSTLTILFFAHLLPGCFAEVGTEEENEIEQTQQELITTVGTAVTVTGRDDTYLRLSLPFATAGSEKQIVVDGGLGTRSVVRFDNAELKKAVGTKAMMAARLELAISSSSTTNAIGTPRLELHRMTKSWTESSGTWNRVFGLLDTGYDTAVSATATMTQGQQGTVALDVTNDVAAFIGGKKTNYGWTLSQNPHLDFSNLSVRFDSKEAANGPRLVITLADGDIDLPVKFDKSKRGVLVVDATGGKGMLDVPDQGKVFSNRDAVVAWAVQNLNAVQIVAEDGLKGALFQEKVYGQPTYLDAATQSLVIVNDVAAALLGGKNGIVTVGTERVCLRDDGCGSGMIAKSQPSSKASECQPEGYCIKSESWHKDITIPLIKKTLYTSTGSSVEQTKGGYQEKRVWCRKWGFIPWRCTRPSGSNELVLSVRYTDGEGAMTDLLVASKKNADKITQSMKGFFASLKFKYGDGGVVLPPAGYPTPDVACTSACEIDGICAWETSIPQTGGSTAAIGPTTETSKGDVSYVCDDVGLI